MENLFLTGEWGRGFLLAEGWDERDRIAAEEENMRIRGLS